MAEEIVKKKLPLTDIIKVIGGVAGAIAVFVPLWAGILNYRQSVRDKLDVNFRNVVEKLSSKDEENRVAAASSLGTFIYKKNYHNETIDILINKISIELNYNVLNAILGSLKKVDKDEYKNVLQKLLTVERNLFIQKKAVKNLQEESKRIYTESSHKYLYERNMLIEEIQGLKKSQTFKESGVKIDSALLNNLEEEMRRNWEIYYNRDKDFIELAMHKQSVTDFISSLLGETTKLAVIEEVVFNQNSLNNVILAETDLSKSTIKRSAFSSSTINNTIFDSSEITDTVFTGSNLKKSSFKKCNISLSLFDDAILKDVDFSGSKNTLTDFNDVFFAGSDLTGAKFEKVKGIKAIHFYEAKKINKAIFDDNFKKIPDEVKKISEDEFIRYILNSELSKSRKDTLLQTIDILRKRYKYFVNAVITHVWLNDESSRLAAFAAYMVASDKTIQSMTDYIDRLNSKLTKKLSVNPDIKPAIDRLLMLKEEIKAKPWDVDEIMKDKEQLRNHNIKYLNALETGDADIFISKYPDIYTIFKELNAL